MSDTKALALRGDIDLMTLGDVMVQSGFFQDSRQAAQAVVKILAGRELGFGPIASMTGVNVIKGRVTLSANLIAAAIKRSGRYNYRVTRQDDKGCTVEFFEGGQLIGQSSFDEDDAKLAGLAGGDNWRKYPRNMYFARAISNGAKWFCPDIFGGPIYTPDEMGAEEDQETGAVFVPEVQPPAPYPESKTDSRPVTPIKVSVNGEIGSPAKLLEAVNKEVGGYYKNAPHLFNALGQEIDGFGWPAPKDLDGWNVAHKAAVDHFMKQKPAEIKQEEIAF